MHESALRDILSLDSASTDWSTYSVTPGRCWCGTCGTTTTAACCKAAPTAQLLPQLLRCSPPRASSRWAAQQQGPCMQHTTRDLTVRVWALPCWPGCTGNPVQGTSEVRRCSSSMSDSLPSLFQGVLASAQACSPMHEHCTLQCARTCTRPRTMSSALILASWAWRNRQGRTAGPQRHCSTFIELCT